MWGYPATEGLLLAALSCGVLAKMDNPDWGLGLRAICCVVDGVSS